MLYSDHPKFALTLVKIFVGRKQHFINLDRPHCQIVQSTINDHRKKDKLLSSVIEKVIRSSSTTVPLTFGGQPCEKNMCYLQVILSQLTACNQLVLLCFPPPPHSRNHPLINLFHAVRTSRYHIKCNFKVKFFHSVVFAPVFLN